MEDNKVKSLQKYFNVVYIAFCVVDPNEIANEDSNFYKIKQLSKQGAEECEKEKPNQELISDILDQINEILKKPEKPIPNYVKGTNYVKGGLAIVGEKRQPEIIVKNIDASIDKNISETIIEMAELSKKIGSLSSIPKLNQ